MKFERVNCIAINLSDPVIKRRLISRINSLEGIWELTLEPVKPTRSLNQNRYYFSALVLPFKEWIQENYGDPSITNEQAHVELKKAVLGTKHLEALDGEILEIVPDTHEMPTNEFSTYIDQAAEFLARVCNIVVLPAELFYTK